jgi:hypothetical protein
VIAPLKPTMPGCTAYFLPARSKFLPVPRSGCKE